VRAELLSRGYVVATLNYRLGTTDQWPAQIQDVKCAIRHLRADGDDYGGDGTRIGVWGASAGAHLTAMLGLTDGVSPTVHDFEGPGYGGVSSSVLAAATLGAITDMTSSTVIADELNFSGGETTFAEWAGPWPSTEMEEASPITWASGNAKPFLLIHGGDDVTVLPAQSSRLDAALTQSTLRVESGGGHNLEGISGSALADIVQQVSDFLDDHVKFPP
jgi:acetyl esterase/lipase